MARVIVVGAGVVGLTCAVRLLERGHDVAVLARDLPLETTSAVAPALWYPHRAYPFERVTGWARTSYNTFAELATDPETGVVMREGTELLRTPEVRPWWAEAVPELAPTQDVASGYAAGWSFSAPVVETPVYLPWLRLRVEQLGGTVTRIALPAMPSGADLVVNAAGLGARLFGEDPSVVPVRGQVVVVEQVGLERWWLDASGPTYVVPRSRDIVVGGTEDEDGWAPEPDPAVGEELLGRATQLVPQLRGARVLAHRVGLRPARPSVRLEAAVSADGRRVIHCYGHGGAGVTLSWGCADEVADLAAAG